MCNADLVVKFQSEETQSSEAVCPLDCCVLVFSYLSCLTGSVSVLFKCLCDCDTLCLRPPLELRGQASKVNASSHHKDQHQQPGVKCPHRSLSQTRIRVAPSVTHFWPPFYSRFQPQTAGLVLDTCTRPLPVSSCCVFKLVSMVLSNFMIGIDN